MIMVHGDNKGLVLPPKVAPIQLVIVPIFTKQSDNNELSKKAKEIIDQLEGAGFRAHFDSRTQYNPGWKYNHWEVKGNSFILLFYSEKIFYRCSTSFGIWTKRYD
jgi:prolyl-tRNA synthetase